MTDVRKNVGLDDESSPKTRAVLKKDEIPLYARDVIDYLKQSNENLPDMYDDLKPNEVANVFKEIIGQWSGSPDSIRVEKIFDVLKKDWKQKTWADAYWRAIQLADKLELDISIMGGMVSDVIEFYGKSIQQTQAFTNKLGGDAGRLLVQVFRSWLDNRSVDTLNTEMFRNWSYAFQVLLTRKVSGSITGNSVQESDADVLLKILEGMDMKSYENILPHDFYALLPVLVLHASDEGKKIFANSVIGKRIYMSNYTDDATSSSHDDTNKIAGHEVGISCTDESLIMDMKRRLDIGNEAREKLAAQKVEMLKLLGRIEESEKTWKDTEKLLRHSEQEYGRIKNDLTNEKIRTKEEIRALNDSLNMANIASLDARKELDHVLHQKDNVDERFRQKFSDEISRVLNEDGKSAWERVQLLGDEHKKLRVNIKNLIKRIAKAVNVESPIK